MITCRWQNLFQWKTPSIYFYLQLAICWVQPQCKKNQWENQCLVPQQEKNSMILLRANFRTSPFIKLFQWAFQTAITQLKIFHMIFLLANYRTSHFIKIFQWAFQTAITQLKIFHQNILETLPEVQIVPNLKV